MGLGVLILGESGTGKSASLRNFNVNEYALINVAGKPLPFRLKGKVDQVKTDKVREIKKFMGDTAKKVIIVDDAQYIMANEFMRRATEKGWDKYTEIAQNMWEVVKKVDELPDDEIVYFLMHIDRDSNGNEQVKTIGKMLQEKITLEGMFAIVLKTVVNDGVFSFSTQNNGHDTVKSPIGLFNSQLIDNDLKAVDDAIRDYYDLKATKTTKVEDPKPIKVEEKAEEPKKSLAEKLADYQNKEPNAEPVEESTPVRKRKAVTTEPVVKEVYKGGPAGGMVAEPVVEEEPKRRTRTKVTTEVESEPQTYWCYSPITGNTFSIVGKQNLDEAIKQGCQQVDGPSKVEETTDEETPVRRRRRQ